MPQTSTVKPQTQSRNRLGHALYVAAKSIALSFLKTLYALWLEVTGLLFAVLTLAGASDLYRHYRADHLADHKRLLIVCGFTLVCAWFTVFSFVKAQRTRR